MKYILEINKFTLKVNIGATEEEKKIAQDIEFNILINFTKKPKACMSDNLHETLCYASLVSKIEQFCVNKSFNLIEHLGFVLYQHLQTSLLTPEDSLRLKICKNPPLDAIKGNCCFIIEP